MLRSRLMQKEYISHESADKDAWICLCGNNPCMTAFCCVMKRETKSSLMLDGPQAGMSVTEWTHDRVAALGVVDETNNLPRTMMLKQ